LNIHWHIIYHRLSYLCTSYISGSKCGSGTGWPGASCAFARLVSRYTSYYPFRLIISHRQFDAVSLEMRCLKLSAFASNKGVYWNHCKMRKYASIWKQYIFWTQFTDAVSTSGINSGHCMRHTHVHTQVSRKVGK